MTMAARIPRAKTEPKGQARPRIAAPVPARSGWKEYRDLAAKLGITLYPWQETAARYLYATGPDGRWLYPEVAVIVARQNGKTKLLETMIVDRLIHGGKVMHTAQNAKLPRDVHKAVAVHLQKHYPELLPKRRAISYALGSEEINLTTDGRYRIVPPTEDAARGPSNDLVIADELREMKSHGFIGAAEPTLLASGYRGVDGNGQMVYLSNAGSEESEVLNEIKGRSGVDRSLAYLEWSAAPERAADDERGWLEANPSIGHRRGVLDYLRRKYESYKLAGTLGIFETEHLCRWVTTTQVSLVAAELWDDAHAEPVRPLRPVMGLGLDPNGLRASAVIAWQHEDGVAIETIADVTGSPIDLEAFGPALRAKARGLGVARTVSDAYSDPLARHLERVSRVTGRDFVTGSTEFVRLLEGHKLRWQGTEDAIGADLPWTTRHKVGDTAWMAVPTKSDRPITAVLAAIRAVGAVTGPRVVAGNIY